MSRFHERRLRRITGLNTSSLPDLIFTVLFFFMIVTNMRKVPLKVEYRVPQGKEIERLTKKSSTSYIYIGRPMAGEVPESEAAGDNGMCIQLNDRYASAAEVGEFIRAERSRMSADDAANMTVNIKADRDTPMGMINDVKRELRKAYALNIVYSAEFDNNH